MCAVAADPAGLRRAGPQACTPGGLTAWERGAGKGARGRGGRWCDYALRRAMISRSIGLVLAGALAVLAFCRVQAVGDPSAPAVQERRQPPAAADAESEYNRGVRARVLKDWAGAVEAFKRATAFRADFPEAWNELGYALRNLGRYRESVDAYQEALRLRPNFPEALEYLGEAYVKMRRSDDARRILERLRPLDAHRAEELAEAIKTGK